jgi:hypothetical protein
VLEFRCPPDSCFDVSDIVGAETVDRNLGFGKQSRDKHGLEGTIESRRRDGSSFRSISLFICLGPFRNSVHDTSLCCKSRIHHTTHLLNAFIPHIAQGSKAVQRRKRQTGIRFCRTVVGYSPKGSDDKSYAAQASGFLKPTEISSILRSTGCIVHANSLVSVNGTG